MAAARRENRPVSQAGISMPVQMQLSRIIISEINPQQVIYLKEVDGERTFPILIGLFEAESINTGVKRVQSPRPRTHELLVKSIEEMGGELDSVVISELKDHIYFAKLRVKRDGELIEIDSRPSDAIAVAVACDPILPIYVAEEVLEESSAS
jgi:bifunctional DNase/RNase